MRQLRGLALLLGGLLAVTGLVVLSVAVVQSQQRARADAFRRFTDRGELAAQLLAGVQERASTRQSADAQLRLSGPPTPAALKSWEGESDPAIPYTALYDGRGHLLAANPSSAEPAVTESGRGALELATQGQPATSGVVSSSKGPVIETFVPFPAGDAGLRVLVVAVPAELFSQLAAGTLKGAAGTPSGNAYAADREGTLVTAVGESARGGEAALVSEAIRQGRDSGRLGDRRLVVHPVAGTALVVALTAPEDELTADLPSTLAPRLALMGFALALLAVFWLTARAVRDNRRLEEARKVAEQASRAAERANLAKSDFLSRMSHELRTPLNAILGFGQLLQMEELTEDQRQSVAEIVKGGRHLLDLINEVLDIARIEVGKLAISVEAVAVDDVVGEALGLIRGLADQRGLVLGRPGADPHDLHVLADKQRLKQVLLNLLSNAIKYNGAGGTVHLSYGASNGKVRISVSDTGPGIPGDKLDQLFVPFERLGAEGTAEEGTGLGLALSKRLMEAMGGALGVESEVGKGSTFWAELPRAENPVQLATVAAEEHIDDSAGAALPARTVLYIEDNLSNLKLIERVLARRPDITLLTAMQGRLGLDLARQHRPDLILLDLQLPDVPGREILRALKGDERTRDIEVVVVSADATQGQLRRLLEEGARAYLTKPVDIQSLLRLLDEELGQTA